MSEQSKEAMDNRVKLFSNSIAAILGLPFRDPASLVNPYRNMCRRQESNRVKGGNTQGGTKVHEISIKLPVLDRNGPQFQ